MTSREVLIIDTGCANLASVIAAFDRLNTRTRVTRDARAVRIAPLVVLPGVGSFGAAMRQLREADMDRAIVDRVREHRSLLAICLGMQVLCAASDESPGVAGLGIIPGTLRRFDNTERVPHMGWNHITTAACCNFIEPGAMYFANSYRLNTTPQGWSAATATHGDDFVCALERENVLACQFHPELSGAHGLRLIERWLIRAETPEVVPCS